MSGDHETACRLCDKVFSSARNCKRHKVDKRTASSTFKLSSVIKRAFSVECNVKDFVF